MLHQIRRPDPEERRRKRRRDCTSDFTEYILYKLQQMICQGEPMREPSIGIQLSS